MGGYWYHDRSAQIIGNPRHNSGNNFLYVDGHVKWHSTGQYMSTLRSQGDYGSYPTTNYQNRVNY
ncbi:MAG: hypothetical protein GW893_13880 [Armatimonadetes bacterium]|nr:hypothetical protein [Armatimonadota bacterium]PIU67266.1 MAG: hypothetical protein COS85_01385 [Armatimonadetes bacterium CG07_land_8_20_14_0_80_59_28]PIX44221.1 MAG: hypothetical protein COZ56_05105 [Armatimonadetes bacterium CG_4_8_14_3_um_filter_58_9]PIY41521.1 MAG: hypothetical protein COZ05_15590 [Armatimonadetes bacterium CG_4_10_14_3_um_filter_59_10]